VYILLERFPNGHLKVLIQHEENSYFWKSNLTECPPFSDEKDRIEVLTMVDHWNKEHHDEFEVWWNSRRNTHKGKTMSDSHYG